jgi:hypothetical protein
MLMSMVLLMRSHCGTIHQRVVCHLIGENFDAWRALLIHPETQPAVFLGGWLGGFLNIIQNAKNLFHTKTLLSTQERYIEPLVG